ncbi:Os10g0379854, partial [Oryza sativa Japonica Group]
MDWPSETWWLHAVPITSPPHAYRVSCTWNTGSSAFSCNICKTHVGDVVREGVGEVGGDGGLEDPHTGVVEVEAPPATLVDVEPPGEVRVPGQHGGEAALNLVVGRRRGAVPREDGRDVPVHGCTVEHGELAPLAAAAGRQRLRRPEHLAPCDL